VGARRLSTARGFRFEVEVDEDDIEEGVRWNVEGRVPALGLFLFEKAECSCKVASRGGAAVDSDEVIREGEKWEEVDSA